MPLFSYKCVDCGHEFEVLMSISKLDDAQSCSSCGSTQTNRQVSRPNFALRGEGWAKDGYAKGGAE